MIYYDGFIDLFMAVTSFGKWVTPQKNRMWTAILWTKTKESDFQDLIIVYGIYLANWSWSFIHRNIKPNLKSKTWFHKKYSGKNLYFSKLIYLLEALSYFEFLFPSPLIYIFKSLLIKRMQYDTVERLTNQKSESWVLMSGIELNKIAAWH